MKIFLRFAFFASIVLLFPVLANAQSGCSDSPECSTVVLGLVGAAGVALSSRFRSR